MDGMVRMLETVTGAKREEIRQVLACFWALFFLLLSYYLIKPLRNSQFLKEFDAYDMAKLYLIIPILSLSVTKFYNFLCDRVDKFKLIFGVYVVIIGCKIAFTWYLMFGGKPATVAFFFFASVYFLLALATLWACFNYFFTSDQGERVYGFIATGAVLGNIAGAQLTRVIANNPTIRPYSLLVSAGSMAVALALLSVARHLRGAEPPAEREKKQTEGRKGAFWSDVADLLSLPYVRGIAIMVCFLATYTTTVDLLTNKIIDERLAEREYRRQFADLNQSLNQQEGQPPDTLNKTGLKFVYGLKSESPEGTAHAFSDMAQKTGQDPAGLEGAYQKYEEELEAGTRSTFASVYLYQGVLGVILLTVASRVIFRMMGLQFAVMIMPTVALIVLVAFAFPLDLLAVEILLIVSGALNYSLNNASKEILFTATSEETKFKHKPLIEGPAMRTGDITASILKLVGVPAIVGALGLGAQREDLVWLIIVMGSTLLWWFAIRRTGKMYDQQRRQEEPCEP